MPANAHQTSRPKEAGRTIASTPAGTFAKLTLTLKLLANYLYDAHRYLRHAYLFSAQARDHLQAQVLADAHFLEYGMALRQAQPGFGRERALRLAQGLSALSHDGTGAGSETYATGLAVLHAFLGFNSAAPKGLEQVHAIAARLPNAAMDHITAGTKSITREAIHTASNIDFLGFVQARHSIRQFTPGSDPIDHIKRAVMAARETPSSCNRQTSHVYAFTDPQLLEQVRKLQAGNRTFGHELSGLLVVTSNLQNWETIGERYQPWIDGGLFAMTLAYGLHAEGLGTCMLNWSVEKQQDQKLRALLGLDHRHLVVVLMGVGWLPDELSVCASHRLPLSDILTVNKPLTP